MPDKNIVLIGFMGTGKSTVGKILAKKTSRTWVDIDQQIESAENRKIAEIFEKEGEAYFRKIEKAMIRQAAVRSNQVITTGGGAVMDPENLAVLKSRGLVVELAALPETIHRRVKGTRHRPLLAQGPDLMVEIQRLLDLRRPYYAQADLHFFTDGKTAAQVADEIVAVLQKDEEFEFGKDWF